MKPERALIAERPLAEHCPELLRAGPDPAEFLPLLGRMGERLARRLAGVLAPMMGGEAPIVRCQSVREGTLETLAAAAMSPLAANSLLTFGHLNNPGARQPALLTIDAEPVLRIVDRAFGGKGEAPMPLPDRFPMAADMMIAKLETVIGQQIAAAVEAVAFEAMQNSGGLGFTSVRRDSSLFTLEPFAENTPLAVLPLEVEDDGLLPWALTLALPLASLPALFGQLDEGDKAPAFHAPASPLDAPFADVPLTVRAVIVDMVMPFATIAALAPGQVIPVAVARAVPLMTGDAVLGHGTVGAVDDRVAVQLNNAFSH